MPTAVIFDLDGVVYLGNTPVPGANRAIARLREMGIKPLFLTNNATMTRMSFCQKLCGMGIKCAPSDIMNSAHGVGRYLAQYAGKTRNGNFGRAGNYSAESAPARSSALQKNSAGKMPNFAAMAGARASFLQKSGTGAKEKEQGSLFASNLKKQIFRDSFFRKLANPRKPDMFSLFGNPQAHQDNATNVFVIGESGLKSEVLHAGCNILSEREAARAKFVVVGLDRHATYSKFAAAHLALQNGAKFIAANKDPTLPLEGRMAPGSGSLVKLLETAAGREADVVIGKPGRLLLDLLLAEHSLQPSDAIYVGDRPEIDMAMANSAGVKSVLVLTGVAKRKYVAKLKGNLKPTYVLDSAAQLPGLIEKTGI